MSGWNGLEAAIAEARRLVAAEAPDDATAADGEAYVTRVVTAALATAVMGHRLVQGGLAMALPVYGGPNPDYIMRHAAIDPSGDYVVRGKLNGSERVGIGLYTIGRNGAPLIAGYTAFDRGNVGRDGEFALELSADAAGPGTLAIPEGTRILMFRVLHRDRTEPASLNLAGGAPPQGPTLVGGSNEAALGFAANAVRSNIAEYMKWVRTARDLPNSLAPAPAELAETVVGDADTQYFLGGFDLAEREWVEVTIPAGLAGYWSLHAYNFWYEHLVIPGVHDRNAVPEPDGTVRIFIGPRLPGHAVNRIDTLGRRKGALVFRIIGKSAAISAPSAKVGS
jgi:hypothetical protein